MNSSHGSKSSRIVDENATQVRIPDGDSDVDGSLIGGRKTRVVGSSAGRSMEAGLQFPVLDRYRQTGEPIEGGMGVVYRALDVHVDIDVAIAGNLSLGVSQFSFHDREHSGNLVIARLLWLNLDGRCNSRPCSSSALLPRNSREISTRPETNGGVKAPSD